MLDFFLKSILIEMSSNTAIIVVPCWEANDYALLQQCVTDCSSVSFVVVPIGEFQVDTSINTSIITWDSEILLKNLSLYQISSLPYCIILDESGKFVQSFTVSGLNSPVDQDVDHFAQGIESYNNFDLFNAVKWFHLLLKKEPHHLKGLFNMASMLHMSGFPMLSIPYVESLLILTPDDVTAHSFLWALTSDPLCKAMCTSAYRRLATSGDLRAITKLATLTGEGTAASRGDPSYARQIYDDMADKFEGKLVDCLGYKGPWLMLEMLETLNASEISGSEGSEVTVMPAAKGQWRILDVGCGSGLCGRVFVDFVKRNGSADDASVVVKSSQSLIEALGQPGPFMVGIDISQRMVDITLEKGGYDYAEACDLSAALESIVRNDSSYSSAGLLDMVIAADTFIYVGALGDVFASVRRVLKSRGLLMFSTEDLDTSPMKTDAHLKEEGEKSRLTVVDNSSNGSDNEIGGAIPGWGCQLLKSARFAHSHRYIEALCVKHQFKLVAHRSVVLRTEETIPLNGNLYIVQKCDLL